MNHCHGPQSVSRPAPRLLSKDFSSMSADSAVTRICSIDGSLTLGLAKKKLSGLSFSYRMSKKIGLTQGYLSIISKPNNRLIC